MASEAHGQRTYQILIVPGTMGTRLLKGDEQVWPAFLRPGLGELGLGPCDPTGRVDPATVIPGTVIGRVGLFDNYDGIRAHFENRSLHGPVAAQTFTDTFPYDWRLPIAQNSDLLGRKIRSLPAERTVVIVAHSLGGLVANHLLVTDPEAAERVGFLFTLGTPWLGSPSAYVTLQEGLGAHFVLFAMPRTQRTVARTIPSVFQLLPSRGYFEQGAPDCFLMEYGTGAGLDYWQSAREADRIGYRGYYTRYNAQALTGWLKEPLRNSKGPIPHYAVAGTGKLTLEAMQIHADGAIAWRMESRSGDGTVPHKSAAHPSGSAVLRYVQAGHTALPRARAVRDWIEWVLSGQGGSSPAIEGLLERPLEADGDELTLHGPADLLVTNSDGQLVAGILARYVINHEPEMTVSLGTGETRRLLLPPESDPWRIYLRSEEPAAVTVRHTRYRKGMVVSYAVFWEVPVGPEMMGRVIIGQGEPTLLMYGSTDESREIAPQYTGVARYHDRTPPRLIAVAGSREIAGGAVPTWLRRQDGNQIHLLAGADDGPVRIELWQGGGWRSYTEPVRLSGTQLTEIRARAIRVSGVMTEERFSVGWAGQGPRVTEGRGVTGRRVGVGRSPVEEPVATQAASTFGEAHESGAREAEPGGSLLKHQFGARLRELRKERSLLQKDLEKALNLRPGAASQYERGLREPGFDLLLTIAEYFGVSVDYLLGRPGAAMTPPVVHPQENPLK